ncbi:hypothetical protein RhiirA4_479341 [Rhizophagus irregularis]|uniref:CCHC-type domain-containing protein n=1 Tax=Rhizophagus irregularis TaxID=588596 RepID=A0A2I1HG98_9GLOM|nr:hypothetical protein RhiirA4_479341 [Rhizophagus irregularis]
MAPPTSPPSHRTRSETAKIMADNQSDSLAESSFRESHTTVGPKGPAFASINKTLEPKEASSKRTERKKKQQQVRFITNPENTTGGVSSSPIFLVPSPGKDNNNTGQSGQEIPVNPINPNDINKQTDNRPIDGHSVADHNNSQKSNPEMCDQQPDLPDIEMIIDDSNDVTQVHKLEQNRIVAKLSIPVSDSSMLEEYKKFLKMVQNNILENVGLKQDDITSLNIQMVTQKDTKEVADSSASAPVPVNKSNAPKKIVGISLQAILISRNTYDNLKEIPYLCDNIEYHFEEIVTRRNQIRLNNQQSRDRVVQIFNASLRITTAIIKPFMRKYGELVEDECYSRRPHVHAPNKQVIYITFKNADSVNRFYDSHALWVYGEMLYVTPFLMDNSARESLRKFCKKLNGIPSNTQAIEFKEFIDASNVIEFYIPRNTYTNETQKYAYVYFKDEEDMNAAMDKVLFIRGKQTEWSDPNVQSCFRCGYTGHYIRDCDYVPPHRRPMRKNDYFRQIKEIKQSRFNRKSANSRPPPSTYAQAAANGARRNNNRNYQRQQYNQTSTRTGYQNKYPNRYWNSTNINPNQDKDEYIDSFSDDDEDFGMDDSSMYEWDEPPKNQRRNFRSRDFSEGTKRGGSMHMSSMEKNEHAQRQTNDNLQDIKNDFAKVKDMMDCMIKEQASMRKELDTIKVHHNPNLKDRTASPSVDTQNKKRGGIIFNSNNKRARNDESSGSDTNAANNVYLLSNRMDKADDTMKTMMDMLTNMSSKFEQIYQNQNNNNNKKQKQRGDVIEGDNNASTSTDNNI